MKNFYIDLNKKVKQLPFLVSLLFYTRILDVIVGGVYFYFVFHLYVTKEYLLLIPTVLKPVCVFCIVSVLRRALNFKRPFEVYRFKPIIDHDGGTAFPSRHAASALTIALSLIPVNFSLAMVLLAFAAIIGISRILTGVHFIKDVLVGYLIAIIAFIL